MNLIDFFQTGNDVYEKILMPVCSKYNISYMELTVLLFLANNPSLDKASDIVEKRHIAKSHVSISVNSLMQKGLIIGERKEKDKRIVHLVLTDKAIPVAKDGQNAQKEFANILIHNLNETELLSLKNCFDKIAQNIMQKEKELKK